MRRGPSVSFSGGAGAEGLASAVAGVEGQEDARVLPPVSPGFQSSIGLKDGERGL